MPPGLTPCRYERPFAERRLTGQRAASRSHPRVSPGQGGCVLSGAACDPRRMEVRPGKHIVVAAIALVREGCVLAGAACDPRRMEVRPGKHIVVAAIALVREGCVLTVRKRGTQRFMLVGGKLEPGETAREAALRETLEEVGLRIDDATLLGEF